MLPNSLLGSAGWGLQASVGNPWLCWDWCLKLCQRCFRLLELCPPLCSPKTEWVRANGWMDWLTGGCVKHSFLLLPLLKHPFSQLEASSVWTWVIFPVRHQLNCACTCHRAKWRSSCTDEPLWQLQLEGAMFNQHEHLHLPLAWHLGTVTVPVGDFAVVALEEWPSISTAALSPMCMNQSPSVIPLVKWHRFICAYWDSSSSAGTNFGEGNEWVEVNGCWCVCASSCHDCSLGRRQLIALWARQLELLNVKSCPGISLMPLQSAERHHFARPRSHWGAATLWQGYRWVWDGSSCFLTVFWKRWSMHCPLSYFSSGIEARKSK